MFWISFHSVPGLIGWQTTVVFADSEHEARLRAKWRYPLIEKQSICGPWYHENDAIYAQRWIKGAVYDRLVCDAH